MSTISLHLQHLLTSIAGATPLLLDDPVVWKDLNTLPQRLSKVDPQDVHNACTPYWTLLGMQIPSSAHTMCNITCTPSLNTVVHNASTGNYQRFLEKTTSLLKTAHASTAVASPAINALVLLQSLMQHIAEKLEPRALQPFVAYSGRMDGGCGGSCCSAHCWCNHHPSDDCSIGCCPMHRPCAAIVVAASSCIISQ